MSGAAIELDVLVFGGGAAGMWLLDGLARRGDRVLLAEPYALGHGQTIASQGIIHGGLKYTLTGMLTGSAKAIREMPGVWRDCLAGKAQPDLRGTRVRSEFCYLWSTQSLRGKVGLIGAKRGLRVAPKVLSDDERPALLAACPGSVLRLDEQVISPASFLADLSERHARRLLHFDPQQVEMQRQDDCVAVTLKHPHDDAMLRLRPRRVIFCAGGGNAALRQAAGLSEDVMQRRPLHMVLLRGFAQSLPPFNGHCADGAHTRVTITSDTDAQGRTIWQVGGQIAEEGVAMSPEELVRHAKAELSAALSGHSFDRVEWATYRVDRAEKRMPGGLRPENVTVLEDGPIFTAWPTKLALVPELARRIVELIPPLHGVGFEEINWPRPAVALPPWETEKHWLRDV